MRWRACGLQHLSPRAGFFPDTLIFSNDDWIALEVKNVLLKIHIRIFQSMIYEVSESSAHFLQNEITTSKWRVVGEVVIIFVSLYFDVTDLSSCLKVISAPREHRSRLFDGQTGFNQLGLSAVRSSWYFVRTGTVACYLGFNFHLRRWSLRSSFEISLWLVDCFQFTLGVATCCLGEIPGFEVEAWLESRFGKHVSADKYRYDVGNTAGNITLLLNAFTGAGSGNGDVCLSRK
ncbi:hypothetical protein Tco_0422275 [Tanacetum coccineum]